MSMELQCGRRGVGGVERGVEAGQHVRGYPGVKNLCLGSCSVGDEVWGVWNGV